MSKIRVVLLVVLSALIVSCQEERLTLPTEAATDKSTVEATSHRRHAARFSGVTFTGRVTDSVTGGPAPNVRVDAGGISVLTDANGYFNFTSLPAGPVTATFTRFGLVDTTRSAQLVKGYNVLNVPMQGKPTMRLTDTLGHVHVLDRETSHFYSIFALLGYQQLDSFNFCRSDGSRVSLYETDLALVTGPGQIVSASCCAGNGTQVTVTTRAADTMTVNFADCTYYHVVFRGNNRQTGAAETLELDHVQRIEFP